MRHLSNICDIRCTPVASSQCPQWQKSSEVPDLRTLDASQAREQMMYHTMVHASCAREHVSYIEHARHPLHANSQLTMSVMAEVFRFTSPSNARRVPSARANDVPYVIRASYAQEHASHAKHAQYPLHAQGQLTTPAAAKVVRFTSPLNTRRVPSARANDVSYDGPRILRPRTCVSCQTCAISAARQRPARSVPNGRLRAPKTA